MHEALPGSVPQPFVLLDAVSAAGPDRLIALRRFESAPVWQGLEAAAQAAALHQRFLAGFSCHAFLLSVDECRFPGDMLDGLLELRAVLLGRSLRAATYRVDVYPVCPPSLLEGGGVVKAGEGLFGTGRKEEAVPAWSVSLGIGLAPYDGTFKRELLEPRYRRLFQWLTQNAPSANPSTKG